MEDCECFWGVPDPNSVITEERCLAPQFGSHHREGRAQGSLGGMHDRTWEVPHDALCSYLNPGPQTGPRPSAVTLKEESQKEG